MIVGRKRQAPTPKPPHPEPSGVNSRWQRPGPQLAESTIEAAHSIHADTKGPVRTFRVQGLGFRVFGMMNQRPDCQGT